MDSEIPFATGFSDDFRVRARLDISNELELVSDLMSDMDCLMEPQGLLGVPEKGFFDTVETTIGSESMSLQYAERFQKKSKRIRGRSSSRAKSSSKLSKHSKPSKPSKLKTKKKKKVDTIFADLENVFNGLAAFLIHFEPYSQVCKSFSMFV